MKTIPFYIHLLLLILLWQNAYSQTKAEVFYKDGSRVMIDTFTLLTVELVYTWNWYDEQLSSADPGDYFKELDVGNIKEMTFVMEQTNSAVNFHYKIQIEGITDKKNTFREKIRTWDWLEIQKGEGDTRAKQKIIFYHEKKNLDIEKIVFY